MGSAFHSLPPLNLKMQEASQCNVDIPRGFQIFATVHQPTPRQKLNLSPATRSRFTEIYIPGYSDEGLKGVMLQVFLPPNPV